MFGVYEIYEAPALTATGKFGREQEYTPLQIMQKNEENSNVRQAK
jgi:hypothetical protein